MKEKRFCFNFLCFLVSIWHEQENDVFSICSLFIVGHCQVVMQCYFLNNESKIHWQAITVFCHCNSNHVSGKSMKYFHWKSRLFLQAMLKLTSLSKLESISWEGWVISPRMKLSRASSSYISNGANWCLWSLNDRSLFPNRLKKLQRHIFMITRIPSWKID